MMYKEYVPAAFVVQKADPLLVSGPVLADIWFDKGIPIVEYPGDDIYDQISDNVWVDVNGQTGEIVTRQHKPH